MADIIGIHAQYEDDKVHTWVSVYSESDGVTTTYGKWNAGVKTDAEKEFNYSPTQSRYSEIEDAAEARAFLETTKIDEPRYDGDSANCVHYACRSYEEISEDKLSFVDRSYPDDGRNMTEMLGKAVNQQNQDQPQDVTLPDNHIYGNEQEQAVLQDQDGGDASSPKKSFKRFDESVSKEETQGGGSQDNSPSKKEFSKFEDPAEDPDQDPGVDH